MPRQGRACTPPVLSCMFLGEICTIHLGNERKCVSHKRAQLIISNGMPCYINPKGGSYAHANIQSNKVWHAFFFLECLILKHVAKFFRQL